MHHALNSVSFDALENRSMLSGDDSVSPPTPTDPAALEAAKQAVLAKATQFVTNVANAKEALSLARETRAANAIQVSTQLKSLITELKSDHQARHAEKKENDAAKREVKLTWRPILSAGELDVKTDTEGETQEERDADYAKFMADRATYREQLEAVETERRADELKWKREIRAGEAAIRDLRDDAHDQRKDDDRAVKRAERALKDVFQSDRKIVDQAIKAYRKLGGDVSTLELPALPKK